MRIQIISKGKNFFATTITASIAIAITFTLNACGGSDDPDDPNNPNNPNGGGGVPFNENSQIYNRDGTKYEGSGDIEISLRNRNIEGSDYDLEYIIGSVTNGIITLDNLPALPEEYLEDFLEEEDKKNCTDYTKDIKVWGGSFYLTNRYLEAAYADEQIGEMMAYVYFSKTGKITCNLEHGPKIGGNAIFNINATKGWNKMYMKINMQNGYLEYSTNNILTKELKWMLSSND
jgi:hypothetical protein